MNAMEGVRLGGVLLLREAGVHRVKEDGEGVYGVSSYVEQIDYDLRARAAPRNSI